MVVSQRLVKKIGGGRRAAIEALFPDEAIREMIREGKHILCPRIMKSAITLTRYNIVLFLLTRFSDCDSPFNIHVDEMGQSQTHCRRNHLRSNW